MATDGALDLHIRARMDRETEAVLAWRRAAAIEVSARLADGEPSAEMVSLVSLLVRGLQLVDACIEAHPTTRACDG